MQGLSSITAPDVFTTHPHACLLSAASGRPSISTGKERDTESGNDYFGARYYASSMGRFMSPDWSAKVEPVPYSKLGNPQTLNLYAYVGNNPIMGIDPDGHMGSQAEATAQATEDWVYGNGASLVGPRPGDKPQAQQQNGSSSGGGFLHWLGHGLSNWAHLQSWNYIKATVTAEDVGPHEPHEPNGYVTAATDAAGLGGLAASEKVAKPLGRLGAAASILNDPSPKNITTNVLGLLPGFDGPMAITGAFNDFLDWGINNGTGRVSPKAYDNDQLRPTLPTQDGGCLAAGSDFPC